MKKLLVFIVPLFLVLSCGKGPETVTVNSGFSEIVSAPDSIATYTDSSAQKEDFVHITLGELGHIETLDPLFASSASEQRVIHLLYDGLTRLDAQGNIEPALAKRWEVNSDSTQFTFHLKINIYFHDSEVFQSGNGRRFLAKDVLFAFQRMANMKVPDFTAKRFMDIRGFAAYHNEQTFVKNPDRRVLTSIEGIRVANDSTLTFYTTKPADDFLRRLAHPSASIYARESVPDNGTPIQHAAGTGPFRFIKKEGSTLLLTANRDYSGTIASINRLDIVSGLSEKDLFQQFARANLDALIELGPSSLQTIADSAGNLLTGFYQHYQLRKTAVHSSYPIYFNQHSGQEQAVQYFLNSFATANITPNKALGTMDVFPLKNTADKATSAPKEQLVITHSAHPAYQYVLDKVAVQATDLGYSFAMSPSYALTNEITFSTIPYPATAKILSWKYPVYVLTQEGISGIRINAEPWNIDLSMLQKPDGSTE
jgi:ABC-type transport system substrate-binding protein